MTTPNCVLPSLLQEKYYSLYYPGIEHKRIVISWQIGDNASSFTVLSGPRNNLRGGFGVVVGQATGTLFSYNKCVRGVIISDSYPDLSAASSVAVNCTTLYLWGASLHQSSATGVGKLPNYWLYGIISFTLFLVRAYNEVISRGY